MKELIRGHHKGKIRQTNKAGDLVSSAYEIQAMCHPCLDPDLNKPNAKDNLGTSGEN